jgi:hypothetical protein
VQRYPSPGTNCAIDVVSGGLQHLLGDMLKPLRYSAYQVDPADLLAKMGVCADSSISGFLARLSNGFC